MSETSQEDMEDLQEIFNKYDRNRNGTIDWDEFCLLLDELVGGMPLDEKLLAFYLADSKQTGAITRDEFIDWWHGRTRYGSH